MRIEVDGRPATAAQVASTDGHFTAMQVRGGGVQGLAHHLGRLDAAHREIFGVPLDGDRVRRLVRHALAGQTDASVRVVLRDADHVAVQVAEPRQPPTRPQRLRSVPYLRPFAHLKHLGGFAQAQWARVAAREGYDDALLTGPGGIVAESSIANIGFVEPDGQVIWPAAPHLRGTGLALVAETTPSRAASVRLDDLGGFVGTFLVNSLGIVAVASVDDTVLPAATAHVEAVRRRVAALPRDVP
ncbi:aminotransferase class IV [Krasilnikoviella flava]|uniref:Branched-chain amino acid aminotransferase/4-amino-4-deoxychorismate lyase n=1 Tax=Krasilnikoviella flava TaxID=526729 RepID=A0A1T5M2H9_9MICO|nr:aminotransferase class IV [Krasilnikoviella flava]SKC82452.1 Branched-chain amino acid aminotransferase/4-amino-4-deoxychorismate lyase [Krasilnikoviella flava]